MSLPGSERSTVRDALYGVLLVVLLAAPTILGFRIAAAGTTQPPDPTEVAAPQSLPTGAGPIASDIPQVVSDRPLGDAPSTLESALTQSADNGGIDRLTFITDGETFGIDNDAAVNLGDGLSLAVHIDPFPPETFHVNVGYSLTRNGEPVTDANFDTTWDMTFMRHGPFTTRLDPIGDGEYASDYEFFMFGPWELVTVLTTPEGQREFTVSVYVWPN